MEGIANIRVLFIAGFGPIVREAAASRKLYGQILGIPFKEEQGGYLHTEALKGAKSFALWPLPEAAQSCYGKNSWPADGSSYATLGSSHVTLGSSQRTRGAAHPPLTRAEG